MEHPLKHLQQIASKWPLEQQKIHTQLTTPIQKEPSSKKTHYKKCVPYLSKCFHLIILSEFTCPIEKDVVGI